MCVCGGDLIMTHSSYLCVLLYCIHQKTVWLVSSAHGLFHIILRLSDNHHHHNQFGLLLRRCTMLIV